MNIYLRFVLLFLLLLGLQYVGKYFDIFHIRYDRGLDIISALVGAGVITFLEYRRKQKKDLSQ